AEPPRVHEEHAAAVGFLVNGVLRLALRADEEKVLPRRREVGHEFRGFLELLERLLQVDDVDPIALPEDEFLHLGVPALGLMTEVDASLEQFLHRNRCQMTPPFPAGDGPENYRLLNWNRARAPRCPYFFRSFMRGSRDRNPSFLRRLRSS